MKYIFYFLVLKINSRKFIQVFVQAQLYIWNFPLLVFMDSYLY